MRRRDVLKSLVALPLTVALGGCEEKRKDTPRSNTIEVHLDGAFAVVIQENKENSVLVFSPRPAKNSEPHHFYFNGSSAKFEDLAKTYNFKLSLNEPARVEMPEINPGLKDFTFKTEKWRVGDSLAVIELPAPQRITFSGQRTQVKFQAGHRQVFMPTNHILEYDVKDLSKHKLECSEAGVQCEPSQDSFPGVTRFFFEVGPKHALELAASRSHAIDFFNYMLHQSFPDLEEQFRLEPDTPEKQRPMPGVKPAVYQYGFQTPRLQRVSYAIDCGFGGLLGLTHTVGGK